MITHKISHIFCVRTRWNRQNCPVLSILNIRLTFPKINGQGFRFQLLYVNIKIVDISFGVKSFHSTFSTRRPTESVEEASSINVPIQRMGYSSSVFVESNITKLFSNL